MNMSTAEQTVLTKTILRSGGHGHEVSARSVETTVNNLLDG